MKTAIISGLAGALSAGALWAQDVTLRVHHFMSENSALHDGMLVPLRERLLAASDGRLDLEIYPSMSLGGTAPDLYDQAVDGAVDIILTLPGYTPGRFPRNEVFELPFLVQDTVAASGALWDFVDQELQDAEFDETRILAAWVHGPGALHTKNPVTTLADLQGEPIRGATRQVTALLGELGAAPVGMPLPAIPENVSKGVIEGAALPWEITRSIKMAELTGHHTEVGGNAAFYTATFVLAMNWDAYEALPDDLRDILEEESGKALSLSAGRAHQAYDADVRAETVAAGNDFYKLDEAETARWIARSQAVTDAWVDEAAGFDGRETLDLARRLLTENQQVQ